MDVVFASAETVAVPARQITKVPLTLTEPGPPGADADDGDVVFTDRAAQRELLLRVRWQDRPAAGVHRFAHTRCSDGYPLHSEIVEGGVLSALTGGCQLLRGTTWTGPGVVDRVTVEVWHDADTWLRVEEVSLTVREAD